MSRLHVLVAYDGSDGAGSTIRAAAALFPGARATVLVAHDAPLQHDRLLRQAGALGAVAVSKAADELSTALTEGARTNAAAGAAVAQEAGLEAESAIAAGLSSPWRTIADRADQLDVDVIACGTRGRGAFARTVLGSTSSGLVHHATRPVLVVPEGVHDAHGPTLLAYDGSPDAAAALQATARLLPGREVFVLYIWDSPVRHSLTAESLAVLPVLSTSLDELDDTFGENAAGVARDGAAAAGEHGLSATGETIESGSNPARSIADEAEVREAAVIVAGARGQGALAGVLLGSVSSTLAHRAQRPTLVVRPTATR
jgi:nucleotide-binding universal stress UspA family protein